MEPVVISAGRSMNRAHLKNWRVYEKEACEKHFGPVLDVNGEDGHSVLEAWRKYRDSVKVVRWHVDPELLTYNELESGVQQNSIISASIINGIGKWDYIQSKERAFAKWKRSGIFCPKYERISDAKFGIIRLNNSVSGQETFLCDPKGYDPRIIWVEYIPTLWKNYHRSFRIHVAGNKVISGYARISHDWKCITEGFEAGMQRDWVDAQKDCARLIDKHEAEIVRAVHVLGLNYQGVDIIVREGDDSLTPIFLEVQPTYAAGYPEDGAYGYSPPYWNPSREKHPELVRFLIEGAGELRREIPMYYERWLDKENHFDLCYQALKESFDVRP